LRVSHRPAERDILPTPEEQVLAQRTDELRDFKSSLVSATRSEYSVIATQAQTVVDRLDHLIAENRPTLE
jgi:hypothetical protein